MRRKWFFFLSPFFIPLVGLTQLKNTRKPELIPGNKFQNASDSLQYALGVYVGKWIENNGFIIHNADLFSKALNDELKKNPLYLSDSIINSKVSAYQQDIQKEKGSLQEIRLFDELRKRNNVGMLPNGVRYMILREGDGKHPELSDTLLLNMIVTLADGNTVIDDTYATAKPYKVVFNNLFPGLSAPLLYMREGSKWQLFIPSRLAYGEKGTARIPPNSALIINLELMRLNPLSPK